MAKSSLPRRPGITSTASIQHIGAKDMIDIRSLLDIEIYLLGVLMLMLIALM